MCTPRVSTIHNEGSSVIMEDLIVATSNDPSEIVKDSESKIPFLPEALQPPTKPVSTGFSIWLAVATTIPIIGYVGAGAVLVPMQVEQMDSVNKVTIVGIGAGIAALMALICTPIAGALSDRTSSRFGRRRPWLLLGTIMNALSLLTMMLARNVITLTLGWCLFQVSYNLILTTLNTLVADQVPETQRGTVSGIAGLSTPIGIIAGGTLVVVASFTASYISMIVIILAVLIPYALLLQDKRLPREYRASFNLWSILKQFWINPRTHPDFGWAWLTRALTTLGYYMGPSLLFYYLQDAVHYPKNQVPQGVVTAQITSTLAMLVFIVIGGVLSDRLQRRKIFVIIASVIIATGLLIQGLFPIWTMVLIAMGLIGFGFGIYIPVDLALITQVLPSANNRGKDLGIINIANMLPQSLAPVIAALVIAEFHSYTILFTVAALITLLSGILIQPIKSVR